VALTDGSANVTDRIAYLPYGGLASRIGTNDTPFLYNAMYGVMSEPNGLLFMRSRFYNPATCRFANFDPIGIGGGINLFGFCKNNPIARYDSTGLMPRVAQDAYDTLAASEDSFPFFGDSIRAARSHTSGDFTHYDSPAYQGVKMGLGILNLKDIVKDGWGIAHFSTPVTTSDEIKVIEYLAQRGEEIKRFNDYSERGTGPSATGSSLDSSYSIIATMRAQAQADGIPALYVTCQPRASDDALAPPLLLWLNSDQQETTSGRPGANNDDEYPPLWWLNLDLLPTGKRQCGGEK
jgi:RHS repeat-associated protein